MPLGEVHVGQWAHFVLFVRCRLLWQWRFDLLDVHRLLPLGQVLHRGGHIVHHLPRGVLLLHNWVHDVPRGILLLQNQVSLGTRRAPRWPLDARLTLELVLAAAVKRTRCLGVDFEYHTDALLCGQLKLAGSMMSALMIDPRLFASDGTWSLVVIAGRAVLDSFVGHLQQLEMRAIAAAYDADEERTRAAQAAQEGGAPLAAVRRPRRGGAEERQSEYEEKECGQLVIAVCTIALEVLTGARLAGLSDKETLFAKHLTGGGGGPAAEAAAAVAAPPPRKNKRVAARGGEASAAAPKRRASTAASGSSPRRPMRPTLQR